MKLPNSVLDDNEENILSPVPYNPKKSQGKRRGGGDKGPGFLGVLKRPDGDYSSELSIGVDINGKEIEIPTMVPTLSREEVKLLLSLKEGQKVPDSIVEKAIQHAKKRMDEGKDVFYNESQNPLPTHW